MTSGLWVQRDASLESFEAAVNADPGKSSAHSSLGVGHHNLGMGKRSLRDLLLAEKEYLRAQEIQHGGREDAAVPAPGHPRVKG